MYHGVYNSPGCSDNITSQTGNMIVWMKHKENVVGFYLSVCKSSGKVRHGQTQIRINSENCVWQHVHTGSCGGSRGWWVVT